MIINSEVHYGRIHFINGACPKHYLKRNDIADGPNGYCHAYILNGTKIFVPATCESWDVTADCYELQKVDDPIDPFDADRLARIIKGSVATRKRYSLDYDIDSANEVLRALGVSPIKGDRPIKATPEVKPDKEKPIKSLKTARVGLKTIKDVEEATGLKGRVIRGILRSAGITKPDIGWAGDEKWYKQILKTVKEAEE